jgi:hypothetical protein
MDDLERQLHRVMQENAEDEARTFAAMSQHSEFGKAEALTALIRRKLERFEAVAATTTQTLPR